MIYNDIEVGIRNILINYAPLQTYLKDKFNIDADKVGNNIYIGHISSVNNPTYPCITFKFVKGGVRSNQFVVSGRLHFDIWAKNILDTCEEIYAIIRTAINLVPINVSNVAQLREVHYEDGLFERATFTHHIAVEYEVLAINS